MAQLYLTKNFHLSEFERSETAARFGIDNSVPVELMDNVQELADWLQALRDSLRERFNRDIGITITSGYRSPKLNTRIKGSTKSAHMQALAADIHASGMSPHQLFEHIRTRLTGYDQVILEYGEWVHVGLSLTPPRKQALIASRERTALGGTKTVYRAVG